MTKREAAELICKTLAIYFFVNAFHSAPLLFAHWLRTLQYESITLLGPPSQISLFFEWLIAGWPTVVNIMASWVLWSRTDTVAARMVRDDEALSVEVDGRQLQAIVFSAIGLVLVVYTLPRLAQSLLSLLFLVRQDEIVRQQFPELSVPAVVATLIQLGLGVRLLVGASQLTDWVRAFRNVGRDDERMARTDD